MNRLRLTALLTGGPAACAALALLVFCSRAWLIGSAGSPLPFWDQWDAEAAGLYVPWIEGRFEWAGIFSPHNEHRIALTRLANLCLFVAFDGWNPWAQLFLNALLHAATAAWLLGLFWPALTRPRRAILLGGLAVFFTATCGWQNALWGFQSQVYFTSLLGVIAIAGLVRGEPFGLPWWLGWSAAAGALFANAGGLLAAVAASAVSLLGGRDRWRHPGLLPALGAIVALGIALRVHAPHHDALHARNFGEFCAVFARCLAWPYINHGWLAVILQAPLVALIVKRQRQRQSLDAAELGAVALGLFAILHAAAVAYSRGAGLPDYRPLSRYQDPLLLGAAAQLFALLRLSGSRIAPLTWIGVMLIGLLTLTVTNLELHLPYKRAQDQAALALLHVYRQTGDTANLGADPVARTLHPSDPAAVERILAHPALRPYLPAELRTANPLPPPAIAVHGLALTVAAAVLLAGIIVLLLAAGRIWR